MTTTQIPNPQTFIPNGFSTPFTGQPFPNIPFGWCSPNSFGASPFFGSMPFTPNTNFNTPWFQNWNAPFGWNNHSFPFGWNSPMSWWQNQWQSPSNFPTGCTTGCQTPWTPSNMWQSPFYGQFPYQGIPGGFQNFNHFNGFYGSNGFSNTIPFNPTIPFGFNPQHIYGHHTNSAPSIGWHNHGFAWPSFNPYIPTGFNGNGNIWNAWNPMPWGTIPHGYPVGAQFVNSGPYNGANFPGTYPQGFPVPGTPYGQHHGENHGHQPGFNMNREAA